MRATSEGTGSRLKPPRSFSRTRTACCSLSELKRVRNAGTQSAPCAARTCSLRLFISMQRKKRKQSFGSFRRAAPPATKGNSMLKRLRKQELLGNPLSEKQKRE